MIAAFDKRVLPLSSVYIVRGKEFISGVLPDLFLLFFILLGDQKISLRPDKLSLPVTVGEYDMAYKTAYHVVTARKIMGVTTVIADCQSPLYKEANIAYWPTVNQYILRKMSLQENILYNHSMYFCVSIHMMTFKEWKWYFKIIVKIKVKKCLSYVCSEYILQW